MGLHTAKLSRPGKRDTIFTFEAREGGVLRTDKYLRYLHKKAVAKSMGDRSILGIKNIFWDIHGSCLGEKGLRNSKVPGEVLLQSFLPQRDWGPMLENHISVPAVRTAKYSSEEKYRIATEEDLRGIRNFTVTLDRASRPIQLKVPMRRFTNPLKHWYKICLAIFDAMGVEIEVECTGYTLAVGWLTCTIYLNRYIFESEDVVNYGYCENINSPRLSVYRDMKYIPKDLLAGTSVIHPPKPSQAEWVTRIAKIKLKTSGGIVTKEAV